MCEPSQHSVVTQCRVPTQLEMFPIPAVMKQMMDCRGDRGQDMCKTAVISGVADFSIQMLKWFVSPLLPLEIFSVCVQFEAGASECVASLQRHKGWMQLEQLAWLCSKFKDMPNKL